MMKRDKRDGKRQDIVSEYRMFARNIENNYVLASFAASSLYGMFLHAALTVCINLVDELEIPEFMFNFMW